MRRPLPLLLPPASCLPAAAVEPLPLPSAVQLTRRFLLLGVCLHNALSVLLHGSKAVRHPRRTVCGCL